MKRILLIAVTLLLVCGAAWAQRLPGSAVPERYTLSFAINFQNDSFDGDESIDLRLTSPAKTITLNAVDIDFHEVTVTAGGGTQSAKVTTDEKSEMATFTVDKELPAGPAIVHIKYTGHLNSKLRGLYLSTYNGRKYAVTQMESTDARVAFPSFDEPAYKAIFDITAIVDKGDTAISNGKIVSDTPGPGENRHTIKFSPSLKMSSYLVALTVGDWTCASDEQDGIPLRICSVPGKENLTHYAMDATKAILHYYDQYFAIKYPFGKLDQIAVPDFGPGAMENAGAIIYRETALLIDDKSASEGAKRQVAGTIAHEMAHQWFGDLVTAAWWDDIWLNEGFATWMPPHPLEAWRPGWTERQEVARNTAQSLSLDAAKNTRPIHQKGESREEIRQLFDGIAYGKAASVLAMLEAYLGPEAFRAGVNEYLKEHAFGNATAADFWNAMAHASGQPVDHIMPTFVMQAGEPFLEIKSKCTGGSTTLDVSQKRFFNERDAFHQSGSQEESPLWQIPLALKGIGSNGSESAKYFLITQRQQQVTMTGCPAFIFPNAGGLGYYRFDYDPTALRQLGTQAGGGLTPEERISLLSDAWALVQVDQHPVGDYLWLGDQLKNTPGHVVLADFVGRLQQINETLVDTADRAQFEEWVRKTFSPMMQQLGFAGRPGDESEDKARRATLFQTLGNLGNDPQVIDQARVLVQQYMKDPDSIEGTLAASVVSVAARHGNAELYNQFKAQLKNTKSPEQYYRYFFALAQFQEPELIQMTLEWSLGPDVRSQDLRIVAAVAGSPDGRMPAWNFLREHLSDYAKKMGGGIAGAGMVMGVASGFCDTQQRDEVQKFFQEHQNPGAERGQKRVLEAINGCIALRQQQQANLASWLNQNGGGNGK
ncbi:MAG: M1 family metallopeptidase [Terriglobales bacterium]|jgi:aminopeptidase N/puromycin-sensitive aminopeptidase